MNGIRRTVLEGLALSLAVVLGAAAQDYSIDWHTIDGGGEMFSTGGTYELGGTIGQPDAGVMTGGTYSLSGGFWAGAGASGPACTCGEVDASPGPTDLNDFSVFAICFGLSAPGPSCPAPSFACSDLNGDLTVDLNDFNTFALLFGSTSTNTVPNCP